jgi:diguanylate cyclase (GGDEF)-like protein
MLEIDQVLNAINVGLLTLDADMKVLTWNRWMEVHSGIPAERIVGTPVFQHYPGLEVPAFVRSCKAAFRFGTFAFFSQKIHRHLFPFRSPRSLGVQFQHMQQSCVMGPIRRGDGTISSLFLVVQDVTQIASYEQRLREMNMRDGLTGVFNRRYLDHRLPLEFERFRRHGRPLSLLILDIDFFKKVNDRFGHLCGDMVLQGTASTLASERRRGDVVARYGGEEFCCLLPETDLQGALVVAERIRAAVAARKHVWEGQEVPVTISIGAAQASAGMAGPAALISRADGALYEAKQTGRDRVVSLVEPGYEAAPAHRDR